MKKEKSKIVDTKKFDDSFTKDPLLTEMYEVMWDGWQTRNQRAGTYKRILEFFDKPMTGIKLTNKTQESNIVMSPLSRGAVESAAETIRFPNIDVKALSDAPEAKEIASIAKGVLDVLIREGKVIETFNQETEEFFMSGDMFLQPQLKAGPNGKKKFVIRGYTQPEIIPDPNGQILGSTNPSRDWASWGFRLVLSASQVRQFFGQNVLDNAVPGGRLEPATPRNQMRQGQIDYYEVVYYENTGSLSNAFVVGSTWFPAEWASETHKIGDAGYTKKQKEAMTVSDEYIYKDQIGDPFLTLSQLVCALNREGPYNFGFVEKVSSYQIAHEIIENGVVDGVRRSVDTIIYASNVRATSFRRLQLEYRNKKRTNIHEIMPLPPTTTGSAPELKALEYPQPNPVITKNAIEEMYSLARNVNGVDPVRAEIRGDIALGQTEILEERRVAAVDKIARANSAYVTRFLSNIISYAIAHAGFGWSKVKIDYDKYIENGEPIQETVNKGQTLYFDTACDMLKKAEFQYNVYIGEDSFIRKSLALKFNRVSELLGVIDPNAYPDAYEQILLSANEAIGGHIDEDMLEKKDIAQPTGGKSQFKQSATPNTK